MCAAEDLDAVLGQMRAATFFCFGGGLWRRRLRLPVRAGRQLRRRWPRADPRGRAFTLVAVVI